MALFNPCMKIKKFLVQMYSFEVVNNSLLWSFFMKCFWLRPCAYLGGWKWITHTSSKILFILRSNKFLACLERVRSYAWSFGHSDPDPSIVYVLCLYRTGKQTYCARLIDKSLSVRFYASQRPVERTIFVKSQRVFSTWSHPQVCEISMRHSVLLSVLWQKVDFLISNAR